MHIELSIVGVRSIGMEMEINTCVPSTKQIVQYNVQMRQSIVVFVRRVLHS